LEKKEVEGSDCPLYSTAGRLLVEFKYVMVPYKES